jgi:hypothetical protein
MDTVVAKCNLQSIQPKLTIGPPNGRSMRTSYTYKLVTNSCLGIWLGQCGLGTWRTQGYLLYLVTLLPLPLFLRFVVLVTVHLYDPLYGTPFRGELGQSRAHRVLPLFPGPWPGIRGGGALVLFLGPARFRTTTPILPRL